MKETIVNGHLVKVEDIIFAEAFSNFLEQAEYLFKIGYFLAVDLLRRTILEDLEI